MGWALPAIQCIGTIDLFISLLKLETDLLKPTAANDDALIGQRQWYTAALGLRT
jgi:hypothetical protein